MVKNLVFIYLEGKGKLLFKEIASLFPQLITQNSNLVEAIFVNLENYLANKII